MSSPLPPYRAEQALRLLLGPTQSADFVVGDLREEFAARPRSWRTTVWYWFEALRVGLRFRMAAWGSGKPDSRPRTVSGGAFRGDLKAGLRGFARRPGLSLVVTLTIGLAIAATTLAFAVVNAILLRPLPFAEPERLVAIWERPLRSDALRNQVAPANFLAWRDELRKVDRLAATITTSAALTGAGEPEQVGVVRMSAAYFDMVGATPLVGRFYREAEDVEGGPRAVVLSERFWRRRFGADLAIVDRSITLNGTPVVVLGVLPDRYDFESRFASSGTGTRDVWAPPQFGASARSYDGRYLTVLGRLAPGVTIAAAQEEAASLARRLASLFPARNEGWGITLLPLHEEVVGDVRESVLLMFGAVCFVLLIACANVANLLLTRAAERESEMALRLALGAGRTGLFRQLLAESTILGAAGGVLGLGLAWLGIRALVVAAPDLPRVGTLSLDGSTIGFALLTLAGATVLFGLAPAIQAASAGFAQSLATRGSSAGRAMFRARNLFVGAQVTLSFVLLVGAGLLIRSLFNRLNLRLGFEPDNLVTAELRVYGKSSATERAERFERIVERVAAVPGVVRASAASAVPMDGDGARAGFQPSGAPTLPPTQWPTADVRFVQRDFFRTMEIPLLQGRPFGPGDGPAAPRRVLINETGARNSWPGEPPLGKRVTLLWDDTLQAEVVGVVGDVRLGGPDGEPTGTTLYWDQRQAGEWWRLVLAIRTEMPVDAILPAVRAAVREVDPDLPIYNVRTMSQLTSKVVARARLTAVALGAFASAALILAVLGLYGVVAFATRRRTREIGIRMALGASRPAVVRMILGQGAGVIGPSILIGAAVALAASGLLRRLVFGVSSADPVTFVAVGLLLVASGLLACWLPARQASRVDPVTTIRAD